MATRNTSVYKGAYRMAKNGNPEYGRLACEHVNRRFQMKMRCLALLGAVTAVIVVWLASVPVVGQAPTAAAKTWTSPRTPDGQPDLQGVWTYKNITPLERP